MNNKILKEFLINNVVILQVKNENNIIDYYIGGNNLTNNEIIEKTKPINTNKIKYIFNL